MTICAYRILILIQNWFTSIKSIEPKWISREKESEKPRYFLSLLVLDVFLFNSTSYSFYSCVREQWIYPHFTYKRTYFASRLTVLSSAGFKNSFPDMSVTLVQSLMAEFGTCFHRKYTDISDHNRILNGGGVGYSKWFWSITGKVYWQCNEKKLP